MGNDAAEFVSRVNVQVRKRQKRKSNVAGTGKERSVIWKMGVAVTMDAATFMGKNFQDNQNSIMKTNRAHPEENVRHICKIGGRTR